jgi:hypothetical protein
MTNRMVLCAAVAIGSICCCSDKTGGPLGPGGGTLTLTTSVSAPGGSIIKVPDQSAYTIGDTVRLTVTTDASHGFIGWTGDTTCLDRALVLVMEKSMTLVANIINANVNGTWTSRTSGVQYWLSGVVWTGSQIVVVGNRGTILTSPDGITWTKRDSITSSGLNSVAWNGQMLVAVGLNGTVVTSNDGVTWTSRVSPTTRALNSVTWAGRQFVAVGGYQVVGTSSVNSYSTVITSPDGITWTDRGSPGSGIWQAVVWDGSQIVAAGFHYHAAEIPAGSGQIVNYSTCVIHYSTNGTTWTSVSGLNQSDLDFRAIAWSGTHFVVTGHPGGSTLTNATPYLVSTNGRIWSNYSQSGTNRLNAAVAVGETFVLAGENGLMYAMSNTGTRTAITSGITDALYGITWTGSISMLVAVGASGRILTSPTM